MKPIELSMNENSPNTVIRMLSRFCTTLSAKVLETMLRD
jgi:hypothetical protein